MTATAQTAVPFLTSAQLAAVGRAQTLGAELIRDLRDALPHQPLQKFSTGEAEQQLVSLAQSRQLTLAYRPRVMVGLARPLQALRASVPVTVPALLTVDVAVVQDDMAGDLGRTLLMGDDGRNWFYHRIFERIVANFHAGLSGCRTEVDAWQLAKSCTEAEGGTLLSAPRHLGHHVAVPHPVGALEASLRRRKEWLEHTLKARIPGGMLSPPLNRGLWSLELWISLDRKIFFQEDLFVWDGNELIRLGERLGIGGEV